MITTELTVITTRLQDGLVSAELGQPGPYRRFLGGRSGGGVDTANITVFGEAAEKLALGEKVKLTLEKIA